VFLSIKDKLRSPRAAKMGNTVLAIHIFLKIILAIVTENGRQKLWNNTANQPEAMQCMLLGVELDSVLLCQVLSSECCSV
jgi:hypothetical protein